MSDSSEQPSIVGVAFAVAELLRLREQGTPVDLDEFFAQHPEVPSEILLELRALLSSGASLDDPDLVPRPARSEPTDSAVVELVGNLTRSDPTRYERRSFVGEGGMGVVHDVWDPVLRRSLARKELRSAQTVDGELSPGQLRALRRFVEEAQVTAQLDHPGVVPVHELGLDAQGRVYFTMKLVRGEELRAVFRKVVSGEDDWNLTRAIGVLQRVCETVAFAHERGVVHRDLKPANVMVGRFGETYVMDWGLAILRGRVPESSKTRVETVLSDSDAANALRTREGTVVGTLLYLSPEQARGVQAQVGPHSDVYAVGAMLYELLAGHPPYGAPDASREPEVVLQRILDGPPEPIDSRDRPPELVAICEKAMAYDARERFASMGQLAEELRAYLENRVVKVYQTGALAEFRKWVTRNRGTAASLLGLLLVFVSGVGLLGWKEQQRADEASRNRELATQKANAELRRRDIELVRRLVRSNGELGVIHPDGAEEFRRWLRDASDVEERFRAYRQELDDLRRDGGAPSELHGEVWLALEADRKRTEYHFTASQKVLEDSAAVLNSSNADEPSRREALADIRVLEPEQEARRQLLAELNYKLRRSGAWSLEDPVRQRQHDELAAHVSRLDDLLHPQYGLRRRVERDLASAEELYQDSIGRYAREWEAAIRSIGDSGSCPKYEDMVVVPQLGLVPLARNSVTGLWEFWHVLSGVRPETDENGDYVMNRDSGIVLVLIPGGDARIGAQKANPALPHFDPGVSNHEEPPHLVPLAPYFASKYELTQGQWMRGGSDNASEYRSGDHYKVVGAVSRVHPVEHVSWTEADRFLKRWGLTLPTESQWEHAARAGTASVFWTGDEVSSLWDAANLAGRESANMPRGCPPDLRHEDPYLIHAPVGSLDPNPWGLHDVHGNVAEWCLDWAANNYRDFEILPGTGEHRTPEVRRRSVRGGGFESVGSQSRCAYRDKKSPEYRSREIGFRPFRALETSPWIPGGNP